MVSEKVLDLENGLQIFKASVDALHPQPINARLMSSDKFKFLVQNIANDKRMETLPLCWWNGSQQRLDIISGHHRIKAASQAGLPFLYVLVIPEPLTDERVKAKQLAHNAIQGEDDPATVKLIFEDILEQAAKLETGISAKDLPRTVADMSSMPASPKTNSPKIVKLVFTPEGFEDFEALIPKLNGADMVGLVSAEQYEIMRKTLRRLGAIENIRPLANVMNRMVEIVKGVVEGSGGAGSGASKQPIGSGE